MCAAVVSIRSYDPDQYLSLERKLDESMHPTLLGNHLALIVKQILILNKESLRRPVPEFTLDSLLDIKATPIYVTAFNTIPLLWICKTCNGADFLLTDNVIGNIRETGRSDGDIEAFFMLLIRHTMRVAFVHFKELEYDYLKGKSDFQNIMRKAYNRLWWKDDMSSFPNWSTHDMEGNKIQSRSSFSNPFASMFSGLGKIKLE